MASALDRTDGTITLWDMATGKPRRQLAGHREEVHALAFAHDGKSLVSLSVTDEGQGMDARILERATDQFFTTKPTGSGLGLNFVERVARAHQGRLELSSQVGRGTTVRLWMP